ncbi:PREDICTED: TRAF3-interacting protein 1-like, partial [Cercocebus atys]|uniref:TRAF3-interacting protein 1-like n=1 Tax=Cercocebus atys TaxID=9531 RepID=UPI0005F3860F
ERERKERQEREREREKTLSRERERESGKRERERSRTSSRERERDEVERKEREREWMYCPDRRPRSPPTLLPGAGLGPPSAGRAQGPRRPPPALETDSHRGRRRLVAGRRGGGVTARISLQLLHRCAGGGGVSSRFPFSPFSDNKQEMRHAAAAQRR